MLGGRSLGHGGGLMAMFGVCSFGPRACSIALVRKPRFCAILLTVDEYTAKETARGIRVVELDDQIVRLMYGSVQAGSVRVST